jgi:hypothetical protein
VRDAGGGGVILIDPATLRRCASTLDNLATDYGIYASSLRGLGMPVMPAPVAARVPDGIAEVAAMLSQQASLHDDAKELRARALWADFADAVAGGYSLSGSELRQFVAGLENGSLMRYAEPWQAEIAGAWVGETYKKSFASDPAKLLELSKILGGSALDPNFSVAFVEHFGGDNLVRVPRVLQAMRWSNALTAPGMMDPFADTKLAVDLQQQGYQFDGDPVSLLANFSMALAVATSTSDMGTAGRLQRQEDQIAGSDDTWAVAQLLSQGQVFGHRFLVQVFQKQLIPALQRDSNAYVSMGMPQVTLPLGDGIPVDAKRIILDALARNPQASAEALSTQLPEKVFFQTPWGPVESSDPIELLYHGYWQDHGEAVAGAYTAATDWLQPSGDLAGTDAQGNTLTWRLAHQIISSDGPHPDALTDALAADIGEHHLAALYESVSGGYEQSGSMFDDGRLYISTDDMRSIFQHVSDRPDADAQLLSRLAHFQAGYVYEHAANDARNAYDWGYRVGAVNQVLLNTHDVQAQVDFKDASEKQKLVVGTLRETIGLLTEENPAAHIVVAYGGQLLEGVGAPDAQAVSTEMFDAKLQTGATVRAVLASGFYAAGHLQAAPAAPPGYLIDNGRLIDYTTLKPDAAGHDPRLGFDNWSLHATGSDDAYRWAVAGASDGLSGKEQNVSVGP